MFDVGLKWEREEKKRREKQVWEKKKRRRWSLDLSWFMSFILVYIDMITDGILNITIFNIFISNSISEVKLKFNGLGI
jgi:hypothetical protein